jgi:asparagine synthase (glutamine-hydrolysing)
MRPVPAPTDVEVLASLLLGPDDHADPLPAPRGDGVLVALERALLEPLQRPPCVVSFSGGRDSSAVLAVATDVARRHGLALPIPVTMRFPGEPRADESAWQELVLEHLGLTAEVVELHDELDALGAIATATLRRIGVRWPANGYLHAPVLEVARGGSLLTGAGGDELLGSRAARHVLLLRGGARPLRSDLREVPGALAPRRVREARVRSAAAPYPWLTSAGERLVAGALAREEVAWPHRWDRAVRHWHASRAYAASDGILRLCAEPFEVEVVNPLLAPPVMAELLRAGGATGFPSRTAAMRALFGTLLPEPVLARGSKAAFTRVLAGPAVHSFAAGWDGHGVDDRLVDAGALRRAWSDEAVDFRSVLLLHQVWLQSAGSPSSS